MASPKYNSLGHLAVTTFLSLFWASLSSMRLLWETIKVGPSNLFYVQRRDRRPDCLEDSNLGQHGFIRCRNQNIRIHYVANGATDKPLMLFLHGFPEFWYSWRHQMKEFSTDYRVVAMDMRGYGESDKPIGISEYYISKLTFDVKEVIEGLGYKSCVLVAHDWGGAVAWNFALEYPSMVDCLVVCNNPHPRAFAKHMMKSNSQKLKSWYMFFFQVPFLPEIIFRSKDLSFLQAALSGKKLGAKPGTFSEADIEAYKYVFTPRGAITGPVNYYRAAMRYKRPNFASWIIENIPVLVVWGANDSSMEKEMAAMSGDYVEDFTLRLIDGASHWVQNDEPELVNKCMRSFLEMKFTKSKL